MSLFQFPPDRISPYDIGDLNNTIRIYDMIIEVYLIINKIHYDSLFRALSGFLPVGSVLT